MGHKTGMLRRSGLLAMGLAIGLVLAEVIIRSRISDLYCVWPPHLHETFDLETSGLEGPSKFTTNSVGIRGDEFTDTQQYRLLAVGGSTTACVYLDDSEAWPHLVQDRMDALLGPGATWVGNVGRPGHMTAQHILQIEKLLPQQPKIDAVVLLVGVNDMLRFLSVMQDISRGPANVRDQSMFRRIEGAFSLFPIPQPDAPWYRNLGLARLLTGSRWYFQRRADQPIFMDRQGRFVHQMREFRRNASGFRDELPDLTKALSGYKRRLESTIDTAANLGVPVVFTTQPSIWRSDLSPQEQDLLWMGGPPLMRAAPGEEYFSLNALAEAMVQFNVTLLEVCRVRRIECLDIAAMLPRDSRVFYDDVHLAEEGARQFADRLSDFLLGLEPLVSMRTTQSG